MKGRDTLLLLGLTVLLPLAVALPLRSAHRATSAAGDTWVGLFPARDQAQYAALASGVRRETALLLANPYDAHEGPRTILLLPLTLVGLAARATGLSIPALLVGLGLVAAILLPVSARGLVRRLWPTPGSRRVGLVVLLLGGGTAFVVARVAAVHPAALAWSTDLAWWNGWSLFGSLHNPLWAVAFLLSITSFGAVLAADAAPRRIPLLVLGVLATLLVPVHPYLGIGTLSTLWVFALTSLHRRRLAAALLPGTLISAAHVVRMVALGAGAAGHGALRSHSPSPLRLLGGYGLLLPLAAIGLIALSRRPGPTRRFLVCGLLVGLGFVYNPVLVGIKFVGFLYLPLTLLGAEGLLAIGRSGKTGRILSLVAGLAVLSAAPQVFRVQIDYAATDSECRLAPGEVAVHAVLARRSGDLVLCAPDVGTRLPWLAKATPYLGHWFLTPDYEARRIAVRRAFAPGTDADVRRGLLDEAGISAVILRTRDAGILALPPPPPFIEVLRAGECSLYVRPNPRRRGS